MNALRTALLACGVLCLPFEGGAQSPPPTLVVVITVDQMRGDYLERFGPEFTGGLASLVRRGAWFTHAAQDHGVTETAPGHSTIGSGRWPSHTGIVTNAYGVPDDSFPLVEAAGVGASPRRFAGTTLFDWMQARWPRSRALSVSLKDRGAILPIGRARQSVFWYSRGQFTTSTWYMQELPAWVRDFNAAMVPARSPGHVWTLLRPRESYPEPDSEAYENGGDAVFPHAMPADSTRAALYLPSMPWGDSLTLALALEGVRRMGLGRGPHPDLLAISLSSTDYIGHRYGPNSLEMHDQMLRLDRDLGAFFEALQRRVPQSRMLVVLTADHGVTPFPEWSREHGNPAAQSISEAVDSVLRSLQTRLGPHADDWLPIVYRDVGLVVFDRPGLREHGLDPDSAAEVVAAALRTVPGLERVDTRRSLLANDTTVAPVRRWRHHLGDLPLGDVMLTPLPGMVLGSSIQAQHGHATDMDTWITLVLAGPGIRHGRFDARANSVDIAPTLAGLLGVRPAQHVDGRVLTEVLVGGSRR